MQRFSKIWVVDDDPIFRAMLTRLLNKTQMVESIEIYQNGSEAMEKMQEILHNAGDSVPEVILLDVNMPILDGWGFVQEFEKIKGQLTSKPTIFIISSSIDPRDRAKADATEIVKGFLEKPVRIMELSAALQAL